MRANQQEIMKQIELRKKSVQDEKYWDRYEAQKHMVTEITQAIRRSSMEKEARANLGKEVFGIVDKQNKYIEKAKKQQAKRTKYAQAEITLKQKLEE